MLNELFLWVWMPKTTASTTKPATYTRRML